MNIKIESNDNEMSLDLDGFKPDEVVGFKQALDNHGIEYKIINNVLMCTLPRTEFRNILNEYFKSINTQDYSLSVSDEPRTMIDVSDYPAPYVVGLCSVLKSYNILTNVSGGFIHCYADKETVKNVLTERINFREGDKK